MSFPTNRGFATTRWSLVVAAGRDKTPKSRAALAELCELYWGPLYAYARRQGHSVEEAQDLTQAFFARFLEKGTVAAADSTRGRFRSFLLTAFKNFATNERDRARAAKRGAGQQTLSLDFDAVEEQYVAEPSDRLTPEAVFERQWARTVLVRVFASLRAECVAAGKAGAFDALREVLVGDRSPGGYAVLARNLDTTEGAVKVVIHRLRRRYRQLLRDEISATVSDENDIDDEIKFLINLLTPAR